MFPFESLLVGMFRCFTGDLAGWAASVVVNALLLSAAVARTGFNRKKRWNIFINSFMTSS